MKKFKSLSDMGAALGVKEKPAKVMTRKCFRCGGSMTQIENTNTFLCAGKNENGEPCRNRLILPVKN